MKVSYEPELAKRRLLAEIAAAATPVLEKRIGKRAGQVTAIWDFLADERGEPRIQLKIADEEWGQACMGFAPEELKKLDDVRWKFGRLWWEVLDQAEERINQSLDAAMAEDKG